MIIERIQLAVSIVLVIASIYLILKAVVFLHDKTEYYGGLIATILVYLENIAVWCLISWFAGILLPGIDAGLGVWLGIFYASYCWAENKPNKIDDFLHGIRS